MPSRISFTDQERDFIRTMFRAGVAGASWLTPDQRRQATDLDQRLDALPRARGEGTGRRRKKERGDGGEHPAAPGVL